MNDTQDESQRLILDATVGETPYTVSRRSFLTRSGYTVAALLALSQWDGVGVSPLRAQGGGGPVRLGATLTNRLALPLWGDTTHWNDQIYYTTMQASRRGAAKTYMFSDVDGDGREEMFIRGPGGLEVMQWNAPNAQWMPLPGDQTLLRDFADTAYSPPGDPYNFTIQSADIDGDGRAEILGRFADGLHFYKYDPVAQNWSRLNAPHFFTDDTGWGASTAYYQTIQCAPLFGAPPPGSSTPPKSQIIGRGVTGLVALDYDPASGQWNQLPTYDRFADGQGWETTPSYWSTIQLADVDGDGNWEVVARAGGGLVVFKLSADGTTWAPLTTTAYVGWGNFYSWDAPPQYSTIQCADIDGDGAMEIMGNGTAGLETLRYDPAGKTPVPYNPVLPFLNDTSIQFGWNALSQYYSIQFADIDGDGAMEMIARAGSPGIMAYKFNTSSKIWVPLPANAVNQELNDGNGWDEVQYYSTYQSARVLLPGDADYTGDGTHKQAVVFIRGTSCVLTYRWDTGAQAWKFMERLNPDFTGTQAQAYAALDKALRGFYGNGNIRSTYNNLTAPFQNWSGAMYSPPPLIPYETPPANRPKTILPLPAGISDADWEAVAWQIYWELQWVIATQSWFSETGKLITNTFLGESLVLPTVGQSLTLTSPAEANAQMVLDFISLAGNMAWAVLGTPILEAGTASAIAGVIGVAAGAAAGAGGGDTLSGTFSDLQTALSANFTNMVAQNSSNLNQVIGGTDPDSGAYMPADYGLFKMFGENILNGVWAFTNNPNLVTIAQRAYAVGCMQAFMPVAAQVYVYFVGGNPPDYYSLSTPSDGAGWYRRMEKNFGNFQGGAWFDDSAYTNIFGDLQTNSVFPLAQKMEWVYLNFSNGWPQLSLDVQNQSAGGGYFGKEPPVSKRPDIRVKPSLARDAKTGETVVTLTIANRGLRNATNVHLTSVTLGLKSALPNATKTHHFLRSNFPETVEVRFSSLAKGTKTILTIRGAYKGGTFGARLRVTIP